MLEIHGLGHAGQVVQPFEIGRQIGIVDNTAEIALEEAVIGDIKTNQGDERPPIRLGKPLAQEVGLSFQPLLQCVQTVEHIGYSRLIRRLAHGESGPVDAVVEALVYPLVQRVDLGP